MDRTRRKDKIARTTTCLLCPSSELDLHNAGKTKAVNNASCVLLTCWVTAASCAAVLLHADSVSNYENTAKGRTEHMCVEDSTCASKTAHFNITLHNTSATVGFKLTPQL